MPYSAAMQTRLGAEVDQDWWLGVILSHASAGTVYLCDQPTAQVGEVDGVEQSYLPVPVRLLEPSRNAEGLIQATLQICAVDPEVVDALDAAAEDPSERIRCRWGQWLMGDVTQQRDPLEELSLTDVVIDLRVINATATSIDILNRPTLEAVYRTDTDPGLAIR